jgi:hypothetical protein
VAASNTPSPGRKGDKVWRDALMIASKRTVSETLELLADPKAPVLAKAAAQIMLLAINDEKPDVAAMKEIGDRLDGKPHASMDVTTTNERDATEWTEGELDGEIARLRAARIAGGKAAKGESPKQPGRVH